MHISFTLHTTAKLGSGRNYPCSQKNSPSMHNMRGSHAEAGLLDGVCDGFPSHTPGDRRVSYWLGWWHATSRLDLPARGSRQQPPQTYCKCDVCGRSLCAYALTRATTLGSVIKVRITSPLELS